MKNILAFVSTVALALGPATVAFAQDSGQGSVAQQLPPVTSASPCLEVNNDVGSELDAVSYGPIVVFYCIGTTLDAGIQYQLIGSGPFGTATVRHIVPTAGFGFDIITDTEIQQVPRSANGWLTLSKGSFSGLGWYPYNVTSTGFSVRSPGNNTSITLSFSGNNFNQETLGAASLSSETLPEECAFVNGFPFCNRNGILFQANPNTPLGTRSSASVSTEMAVISIVGYGDGPYINSIANSSMLYALTPTGQLMASSVGADGSLGNWIPLASGIDPSSFAVGVQGIRYWRVSTIVSGSNPVSVWSYMLLGFHTAVPEILVFSLPAGIVGGSMAVLSATPPVLQ